MISYADNREDVLLARVFRGQPTGFYVDVGAHHPTGSSVTRHFYDAGWHGINIEPIAALQALYATERPRDVTLDVALSSAPGRLELWEGRADAIGLSTLSADQAQRHRRAGFAFAKRTVAVTTLAAVCAAHAADRVIDFLSIDVEGHERDVLLGGDFARFRPRVIMIEATQPNTQTPTHSRWEALLLAADYRFGAFDGLNRFYVRGEEADALLPRLAAPVSVFDDFVPLETHVLREQVRLMTPIVERARVQGAVGDGALAVARRIDAVYNRLARLASTPSRLRAWRR